MRSFGCTVYELYTEYSLFVNDDETKTILLGACNTQPFEFYVKKVWNVQAQYVLGKLFAINPMKRASVEEILRGAYLNRGADSAQVYIYVISFIIAVAGCLPTLQTLTSCFVALYWLIDIQYAVRIHPEDH